MVSFAGRTDEEVSLDGGIVGRSTLKISRHNVEASDEIADKVIFPYKYRWIFFANCSGVNLGCFSTFGGSTTEDY